MNDLPNGDLYADWPAIRREEIRQNWNNRKIGTRVVSETDSLRVWHLVLLPGERATLLLYLGAKAGGCLSNFL